jgi:dUTP pyrophosphatase
MEDEIDLLRDELGKILKQIQEETEGDPNYEIEEIHGVNLKELEQAFENKQPKMTLEFIKIHPDAVSPKYNYPTDSGFDLHSTDGVGIPPQSRMLVGTGLKFNIKDGFEMQVRPKSGLALKQGLTVLNTPGTVDSDMTEKLKSFFIIHHMTQFILKEVRK